MKKRTIIIALIGLSVATLGLATFTQGELPETDVEKAGKPDEVAAAKKTDADKLYELVRQARADVDKLRAQAGIPATRGERNREGRGEHAEGGREGRGEHGERRREGRGEHAEGGREGRGEHAGRGREGRGEHGEGRGEGRGERGEGRGGEEGGKRMQKNQTWNATRNGAHLVLAYDAASQSFRGVVHNTSSRTLSDVRVEVHLSNGLELGPTKRTDMKPGAKLPVELSAANQEFTWWTTHPEHGSEEGHGPGHEGERSEHGNGDGNRPRDPALRPLYNQIQLLRQEIRSLTRRLEERKR